MVVGQVCDRGEIRVNGDRCAAAVVEASLAEVFEPALWALDAVQQAVRSVGVRHRGTLRAEDSEGSADGRRAVEHTGIRPRDAVCGAHDSRSPGGRRRPDQPMAFGADAVHAKSPASRPEPGEGRIVDPINRDRIEGAGVRDEAAHPDAARALALDPDALAAPAETTAAEYTGTGFAAVVSKHPGGWRDTLILAAVDTTSH